jgi:5'-nucleotidase
VNRWVPKLRRDGVEAIGVLIHEGGEATGPSALDPNGCDQLEGPILDINDRIDPAVDLIVSAHTHQAYNCLLPVAGGESRLVTQAGFYGRLVTDIRLTLDGATGDVDRTATYAATNVPVTREAPDARVQSIVDYWNGRAAEAGNVVAGQVTGDLLRARDAAGNPVRDDESVLGTFVANAQLAAAQATPELADPVVAFMNPGGLRTDIPFASSPAGEGDGNVTYRELFDVQPFSNTVNAVTLTGADIDAVLEQQFPSAERDTTLVLSTSDGFTYEYDPARPEGDRVFDCSITIDGVPVDPGGSYRVAANSFLIAGGDAFTAFTSGTDPVTGPLDVDTAVSYLAANSPVTPPAGDHAIPVSTPSC